MIVARQHQYSTMRCRASSVGVLEDVTGAVNAGPFAVPHRKYAVVLRIREKIHLLRAPDAGGGQVFIHTRMEFHVMCLEVLARLGRGLVDTAQGRTTVAGDKSGRIESGSKIALALHHRYTNQSLGAGQEDPPALQCVFIIKRDRISL